tara:strand:- start:183 stop:569 length:387 start_codon:yes stop_codon:yes gene_type:complete
MPKRGACPTGWIDAGFELAPPPAKGKSYRVSDGNCPLPCVSERVSACGRLRLHLPDAVPAGRVRVRVYAAPHEHNIAAVAKKIILQGHVVRAASDRALLSHGGLLLSTDAHSHTMAPGTAVRTEVSWG